MAKNSPVAIWVTKHNPRSDPNPHQLEMLAGAGKSIKALLIILIKGCWVRRVDILNLSS
jgi:hypothetical protein